MRLVSGDSVWYIGRGQQTVLSDGVVSICEEHEDSVYAIEWSCADPWIYASLSYDGRLVISRVPRATKYHILLWTAGRLHRVSECCWVIAILFFCNPLITRCPRSLLWLEVVCSKTESDLFCSGIYILSDCMYCVYHSMHRLLLWVFSCNNLTLIRTKSVCRQCTVLCNTTLNGCLHGQTGVGCTSNKPRCCRRDSTWATVTRVWLVALNRRRLWDNS